MIDTVGEVKHEANMSKELTNALPATWAWSTLGEACLPPQYGWTTSGASEGRIHLLRTTDITSGVIDWNSVPYCTEEPPDVDKYLLRDGDIVISRAGSVGYSCLLRSPTEAVFASYLIRFRPLIEGKYVAYFLQSPAYWEAISERSLGIAIPNVNASKLKQIPLPIAPFQEQQRIVAEIETQFTRLDAGVAALKRVQANLKRYKASVLKAACEGLLVSTEAELAHVESREFEPASVLLERILAERRGKWEQANPGRRYVEPKRPDVDGLLELPEGWVWASIEEVCDRIVDCLHSTPVFQDSGYVCVDTNCIQPGRIVHERVRYVSEATFHDRNRRMVPQPNDILFSREGALLGIALRVPENINFCLGQRMMVFRLPPYVNAKYFEVVLNSNNFKSQYAKRITGTASPHLNIGDIRKSGFTLPPLAEQHRIVAEVERRLSVVQEVEDTVAANLKRAERLRQSILKRAFEGRLVAQDPSDEPASASLERTKTGISNESKQPALFSSMFRNSDSSRR